MRSVARVSDTMDTHGEEINDSLERAALLAYIDSHWTEHLRNLDELKEGIGLRAFGQRDPLIEYKMEAFKLFKELMEAVSGDFVSFVFRAGPLVDGRQASSRPPSPRRRRLDPSRARASHASAAAGYGVDSAGATSDARERDPTAKKQPDTVAERVGRNDPCPCGSGKKYKRCHGA